MKTLPKIPAAVSSALGPVPVVCVPDLKSKAGDDALGLWVPEERTIKLREGMHPTTAWATLRHEWVHVVLWDSGFDDLPETLEERVCDAVGTALVAEMLR